MYELVDQELLKKTFAIDDELFVLLENLQELDEKLQSQSLKSSMELITRIRGKLDELYRYARDKNQ